jgi:hypothetical protein
MNSDPADPQVMVILNNVGEETYKSIKYFGNQKLGIVTQ